MGNACVYAVGKEMKLERAAADRFVRIEARLIVLKSMVGFVLALDIATLVRVFIR